MQSWNYILDMNIWLILYIFVNALQLWIPYKIKWEEMMIISDEEMMIISDE